MSEQMTALERIKIIKKKINIFLMKGSIINFVRHNDNIIRITL